MELLVIYKIQNKKLMLEYFVVSAHGRKSYVKSQLKLTHDNIEGL